MKKPVLFLLSCAVAFALPLQTDSLKFDPRTGRVLQDIKIGNGKTVTIESGGSLVVEAGAAISGTFPGGSFSSLTGAPADNVSLTAALNLRALSASLGTAAALNVPASGDAAAGEAVKGSDTRLTNQRTPSDGSVTLAKINTALKPSGTAATTDESLRALGTGANNAAAGNDTRLADQRTPSDGSVTLAKINTALKPSGTAATTDESLRALGTAAGTAAAGNDTRITGALLNSRVAKTGAYTVVAGDRGICFDATSGTWTLTLTTAATLGNNFVFGVFNSGSGTITIDPAGSETIRDATSSATTKALTQGEGGIVICDGSGFLFLKVGVGGGVDNTAYNATSWDSVTGTAPSKDAVRDQIEAMLAIISGKATALSVASLSSNALALGSAVYAVKEATWSSATSNKTLTFASGATTAGNGIIVDFTFTDATTIIFPAAYRNGAGSTITTYAYPAGHYYLRFKVRADASSIDLDDTAAVGADVALADAGSYFGTDNVEAALQQLGAAAIVTPLRARVAKTATYALLVTDKGNLFDSTSGTWSYTFGSAASAYGAGWHAWFMNSGSGTVTIDPNGSETIRTPGATATTLALTQGEAVLLVCDGTNYFVAARSVTAGSSGIADPGSNGLLARTSSGTATPRTITDASGTYTTTTDGNGVTGNPTIALTTRVKNAVDYVTFVLTIDAVADSMDYTVGYVSAAFTITELRFVHNGTTSSPSITPTVKYGTDRSSGTSVVTSPSAVTSTTTGASVTSFNNSTPAANSWLWLTTASKSGTTDKFTVVIVGHY